MRTFDSSLLSALPSPSTLGWARQWARKFSGDTPNEAGDYPLDSQTDEEWNGWLEST